MDFAKVLTGVVAAWLEFERACDRTGLLSEKYLTSAIGQILAAEQEIESRQNSPIYYSRRLRKVLAGDRRSTSSFTTKATKSYLLSRRNGRGVPHGQQRKSCGISLASNSSPTTKMPVAFSCWRPQAQSSRRS